MNADQPLHPIAPELFPFGVGESVAFREDHPEHAGKYGLVQSVGLLDDGNPAFDLRVFDPFYGPPPGDSEEDPVIYRATMGEIQ